jgi:hypothetical protein
VPEGDLPEFGVYLQGPEPPSMPWETRWVRWKDFWLPKDPDDARDAILQVFEGCATERVEVACTGGKGRTGTVLACLCILAGTTPEDAVSYVRANYHRHAVETPWQRRFVRRFQGSAGVTGRYG